MSINLEKGGRINLSKENPTLRRIRFGLGWEPNTTDTGSKYDLDASLFVCKADEKGNPKLIADEYLLFYSNKETPDGAAVHSGDNQTGSTDATEAADDETIIVDLFKLNPLAVELSFIVTIHDAINRRQNFGQVRNSYVNLYDDETGTLVARYALDEDFSTETAVQFGSLYKKDGQWLFKAVGMGYKKGLADFVRVYGAEPVGG